MSEFEQLHPSLQYHVVNTLGWSTLRPTQLAAIAPIHAGTHCLLLAPTAGGKTEAAAIPILSRMLVEAWPGTSVLYVCPIKALLNNLEPRLSHYAGLVGRRVEVWHGDISQSRKNRALKDVPDILLTTPESVEAMLISARVDRPAWFGNLQAVIVDELHAFAGDDRGWHLRSVLHRLDQYLERPLQRIGLSAMVSNPSELLAWLAPIGSRSVVGSASVSTDADVTIDHVGSLENAATVIARLHRGEKRLVFCDSRSSAEQLSSMLRTHAIRTFVSHASLSLSERRQAEAAFSEERDCVIVATSTLELGIDVGEESLKAGSVGSIKFKLWEGEIADPINDNRFIGMFEIEGSDFDDGVIAAGAELILEYEILDSGNITMEVSVPSIGGSFHSGRNFYSRQEGQIDYTQASKLVEEQSEHAMQRLEEMASKIDDPRLDQAREKLEQAESIKSGETDPELAKQAMDNVQEAKRLLALARKEHLKDIRQLELDKTVEFFDKHVREHARPTEANAFDNLAKTAQRAIDNNSGDFEAHLDDLRGKNFMILWRQDWFVIDRFKWLAKDTYLFPDAREHAQLVSAGAEALKANDMNKVRAVVAQLDSVRIGSGGDDEMMAGANVVRS